MQVARACRASPRFAAQGGDQWIPHQWSSLPQEAHEQLACILNGVESSLTWPSQAVLVLVALVPKPGGGQRPISLTAGLYRLWSTLRKPLMMHWESHHALEAHWDSAVRGSHPLLAALKRELKAEVAHCLGQTVVEVLFDATKFYDSLQLHLVVRFALQRGYPPLPLYLALLVHSAPRLVQTRACISEAAQPRLSILAGCPQSVAWTRSFLFHILQETHERFFPCNHRQLCR